ncbi:uncharacterized protein LOC134540328 [Bacillus rossius redtenbacheri]|uniref:uncharacterized protein LOC134540328 n=1 Tax=Bacillus rossius redtenbacheri TaxID=93214 RepID=UPI002FDDC1B4
MGHHSVLGQLRTALAALTEGERQRILAVIARDLAFRRGSAYSSHACENSPEADLQDEIEDTPTQEEDQEDHEENCIEDQIPFGAKRERGETTFLLISPPLHRLTTFPLPPPPGFDGPLSPAPFPHSSNAPRHHPVRTRSPRASQVREFLQLEVVGLVDLVVVVDGDAAVTAAGPRAPLGTMPNISTLISSAVSLSALAGLVSGFVYLVVAGIRWAGEARLQTGEWLYRQVQHRLSSREATTQADDDSGSGEHGHVMEDAETARVREFIEKLVEKLVQGGLDDVNVSCLYDHPEYDRMFSRYHALLCDTLARLAFSLRMAVTNKPLQDVESPSIAHAQLKQLVKRVVHEAMALPRMKEAIERRVPNGQSVSQDMDSKTYEDILATAILNKVIEKHQRYSASPGCPGVDRNRNTLGGLAASAAANGKLKCDDRWAGGDDSDGASTNEGGGWSETHLTKPVSLVVEECIEQVTTYDSSGGEHEHGASSELDFYLSGLNFIQRHRVPFPELGMDIVDGEDTDGSDSDTDRREPPSRATDLLSPVDSWEENWLFQRRRLKAGPAAHQPVPMLVPNPGEGFRALIGDRDAEEVSDLSECSGEEGEEETLSDASDPGPAREAPAASHVKAEERGCRAVTPDGGYGGSAEEYASMQDLGSEVAEATNAQLFKSASVDCLSEFGQQDSEYTEDYTAATRRQMSSLLLLDEPEPEAKPVPRPRSVCAPAQSKSGENASRSDNEGEVSEVDPALFSPPRPGTIAEREHRKWESAPPLANNPYSSENISKRLQKRASRTSLSSSEASLDVPDASSERKPVVVGPLKVSVVAEPDSKKYGRDYYVNSGGEGQPAMERPPRQQAKVRATTCPLQSSRSSPQDPSKQTDASQLQQIHDVGSEVARWQREINKTERQWLRRIQSGSPQTLKRCVSASVLPTTAPGDDRPTPRLPRVADISRCFETLSKGVANGKPPVKCPTAQPRKQNMLVINGHDSAPEANAARNRPGDRGKGVSPRVTITCYPKPPCVMTEAAVNGNGRHWDTDSVRSEESAVSSADSEYCPCLPSVKELAKQFSGGTESDSSTSLSTSSHRLSMTDLRSPPRDVVIVPRERREKAPQKEEDSSPQQLAVPSRPLRQVHSLTARSMSREFREGLRRNLPVALDRNVHSFGGSEWSLAARRRDEYDTTPGYTSDESGTVSPAPAPGTLRTNIAFWESLKQAP